MDFGHTRSLFSPIWQLILLSWWNALGTTNFIFGGQSQGIPNYPLLCRMFQFAVLITDGGSPLWLCEHTEDGGGKARIYGYRPFRKNGMFYFVVIAMTKFSFDFGAINCEISADL